MRTKNFLFSLLLVGAAGVMSAQAQEPKKKLAVLVVGMESDAKGDDYAQRMGAGLNRKGDYALQTKDDNPAVAEKLAELRAAHTPSTPVDTTGLAAWGKQNDISFVQLVVETGGTKVRYLTAQLLRCSTGQLEGRGTYRQTILPKGMANPTPEMVQVAGGVFEMGCKPERDGAACSNTNELPLHKVRVNNFSIGKFPVTQAQWRAVMGSLPGSLSSTYQGENKPVVYVNWDDMTGFLAKLNELTGRNYRLPTEAEWEYAARGCDGGDCEPFQYSGDSDVGKVAVYGSSTLPVVGTKNPNALGIYDMSGNVYEWCRDYYCGTFYTTANNPLDNPENTSSTCSSARVLRGGGWGYSASNSRVAFRDAGAPSYRSDNYGFRVVLP